MMNDKVALFLKYHDDEANYANNPDGFDKMYSILEKYDNSNGNDTVDIPFRKATPEDQNKMISLIAPKIKFGEEGYSASLYKAAANYDVDNASRDYCDGVTDAIDALIAEGIINQNDI